jgi:predicted P-loop ATPase
MSKTRENNDEFGRFIEEETGGGWRKIRRIIEFDGVEYNFRLVNATTDDYIKAIHASGVKLALNLMNDRVEIQHVKRPISDFDEAIIINRLMDYGLKSEPRIRKAIMQAASVNKYHPVKEYFDELEWDGQDHFAALMNKFEFGSESAEVFFRKFMLGAIAKVYVNGQNYMLVLSGSQNMGKSYLVRWLCPLSRCFFEGPISPDDKDSLIRLIENFLWEVGELDATTRRSDRSALKFFITRSDVKVRVPYGRYDIQKPASASMIGTVNPDGGGFLTDPTGNRRFAIVHLNAIDFSYTDVNRDQLWAQMYAEFKAGAAWELTIHEREVQAALNMGQTTASPLEELFLEHFRIDPSQPEKFTATMDILSILEDVGLRGDQYRNKMELSSVATKLGLKQAQRRVAGKPQRGYAGVWVEGKVTIDL